MREGRIGKEDRDDKTEKRGREIEINTYLHEYKQTAIIYPHPN